MESQDGLNESAFDQACRFIISVGKAAHSYGSTTSQIETYLAHLVAALGYEGTFRATPTEILFAFREHPDAPQRIELIALPAPGQELNRLARLGELVTAVEVGKISIAQANRQLDEIAKTPSPWGNLAIGVSFVIAGAGFSLILGGGLWDFILAATFSLVTFLVIGLAGRFGGERAESWLPLTTAFVAGALAALARFFIPALNPIVVILSAIIVLIPGFTISLGMGELVSNHVISGMSHVMYGLLYMAKQFVGAWLGFGLIALVGKMPPAQVVEPLSFNWLLVMLLPIFAALCFIFQIAPEDFLANIVISAVTFGLVMFGSPALGSNLGNLLATVVMVILANLWSARTERPTTIYLLPAIMLLVSGSVGFQGLVAISDGDFTAGVQQFSQMFVVAATIFVGMLVGNSIVPTKTSL